MASGTGLAADAPTEEVARLLEALRSRCGLRPDELLARKVLRLVEEQPDRAPGSLAGLSADDPRWLAFVEAVTVHETYFFRDPAQLELLAREILPQLIARKAGSERRLRLWSAGCATGEEAYTIAMLVEEALAERRRAGESWTVDILGSDISRAVLALAREGIYGGPGLNAFRRMPERYDTFFETIADDRGGRRRIGRDLARLVRFRQHNLMDAAPAETGFDVALCRNVFIYFDDGARRHAVACLRQALVDGGVLLLGTTDRLDPGCGFRRLGRGTPVAYARAEGA